MHRLAIGAICLAACGELAPRSSQALEEWSVSTDPATMIGVDESLLGHQLFGVQGTFRLADGRIVIVNAGTSEVRFYSAGGELLATTGGPGEGPTEFSRVASVNRMHGDTILLLTYDPALLWIAPNAQVVRRVQTTWARIPCRIDENPDVLPDASLLYQGEEISGSPGCLVFTGEPTQHTDLLARLQPLRGIVDTLAILPGTERDGMRYMLFGRMLAVAASADRIFAGETGGDTIGVWSYDGRKIGTIRVPLDRREISEAVRTQDPQQRRLADGRIVMARPNVPEQYPRFGRLLADRQGYLWVMRYPDLNDRLVYGHNLLTAQAGFTDSAGARWLVFDTTGNVLANVQTPPGLYVLEVGSDYVLGVAFDSLDVESVRLHRLERR